VLDEDAGVANHSLILFDRKGEIVYRETANGDGVGVRKWISMS